MINEWNASFHMSKISHEEHCLQKNVLGKQEDELQRQMIKFNTGRPGELYAFSWSVG